MKVTRRQITALIRECENTLGWTPAAGEPLTRARKRIGDRIEKQFTDDPTLTLRDLELAIELLREKRMVLHSPAGLITFVPEARERGAATDVQQPLDEQIAEAKSWEREHELPGYDDWLTRLIRAQGDFRAELLTEWRQARQAHKAASSWS